MNLNPNSTTGLARSDSAAHATRAGAAQCDMAHAGSRLDSVTDDGTPRDRETDRGREEDDGATRRWWLLQRGQRCYGGHLTRAHLVVPSIEASAAAIGGDDDHGGARPRHGRLRRDYNVLALSVDPTSISSMHST